MKIIELTLQAAELDPLQRFYTSTLALPLLSASATHFCVAAGDTRLCFEQKDGAEGGYHFALQVPLASMAEVQVWLQERVKLFPNPATGEPLVEHVAWQAQALYFTDPQGNIVEFIGHSTLPAVPATAAQAWQVLRVCEIGLAVAHVPSTAGMLKKKLQLQRWQSATATFEAIGDVHGLLILAQRGRKWFPTNIPAAALPCRAVLVTDAAYLLQHNSAGTVVRQPEEREELKL